MIDEDAAWIWIKDDGSASGTVKTPVLGVFVFGNRSVPLVTGENAIN